LFCVITSSFSGVEQHPLSRFQGKEADLARLGSRGKDCDLFVVDGIEYEDLGLDPDDYKCKSGRERAGTWYANENDLTPKTYQYCLGVDFGQV